MKEKMFFLEEPFEKILFVEVKECDIIEYLEKRYSIKGLLFQETKRNDKILIVKQEDGAICEWCEDPGHTDFCIAKVEDGIVKMVVIHPSIETTERWFFEM